MRDVPEIPPVDSHEARLERALIEEFLRGRGLGAAALAELPSDERTRVLNAASMYAAGKLAEIEARAHFVDDLHRHE